jgi:hypothetical protein
MESANPNGGEVGGVSGQPLIKAKPLPTSATVPKPGRARYGPVCPNPETRVTISRGFSARSSSYPSPHASSRPGRKDSTITSTDAASVRTRA